MNYKYMKTSKIDVQGSITLHSSVLGDLNYDLTGSYDIDDIVAILPTDYIYINLDDPENGEVGLRNVFIGDGNLTGLTIEKETVGFDVTKFNNLLKLLGFSNGKTQYTTDQFFSEFDVGWGIVYSPYMGGKIPLRYSVPNNKIQAGYSTFEDITIKADGQDYVSNVGIHSNNLRVRRGYNFKFRGTIKFLELLDVVKDVFKSPVKWYFPSNFEFETDKGLIFLIHQNFEAKTVYVTIGLKEFGISFLKEV